ncbi:hypothetical protein LOK49_LG09G01126 [Camellia lanceoleosa]|uniref:Uncharacterized protein n=1 Tax=Camellia lanceoleosa TaxID=1840588 RepID=A0ACC0GFM2_9ERIC|nr:hypothetical protein LOK49_LG09G01126 [Camellia lanceoleosa]
MSSEDAVELSEISPLSITRHGIEALVFTELDVYFVIQMINCFSFNLLSSTLGLEDGNFLFGPVEDPNNKNMILWNYLQRISTANCYKCTHLSTTVGTEPRELGAFLLFWNVCLHLLLILQHLLFESLQLVLGQGLSVLAKLIDSLALSTINNELNLTGLCCV